LLPLESNFDFAFLIGILATSLVGSAHCIGMCGGLALAATQSSNLVTKPNNFELIVNQIFYHGSRLVSYLFIGFLAGGIGEALLNQKVSFYMSIFASLTVASIFIYTGIKVFSGAAINGPFEKSFSRLSIKIFPKVNKLNGVFKPIATGLATGLLPCAWLYSFVLMSLATKSPAKGALVLSVFWLGTVPALSFGTVLLQKLLITASLRVYRIVGVMLLLIGLWTLYGRALHITNFHMGAAPSHTAESCH
jgi:uncharacterized protein